MEGWIIDAQLGDDGATMDVWIYVRGIGVKQLVVPWCASIHIYSDKPRLHNLARWLEYPEVRNRFCAGEMRFIPPTPVS